MPQPVPKECPAGGCNATFFDAPDERERLASLKQHLYREHLDDMPREEVAELVEGLPSMEELEPAPTTNAQGTHVPPGYETEDERTPPGF